MYIKSLGDYYEYGSVPVSSVIRKKQIVIKLLISSLPPLLVKSPNISGHFTTFH